ncbi:transcriptional regulator, LysR family protein [Plesiocystis pacifica SIR-1]|uniref:Transcriptional regulator, LysR family protein n=1 Tax=Plesiocystis pacifica SIR-1 TaxID=391625 RepID=A6FZX4_9BACT|nr:LysR family transcriptional regulator [Plesiocystis pacifica]EDM80930.1 transcriptional regulator, LysR family protein [Plesiocystis pacifica SIR-1]
MDWRSVNFDWNRARAFLVTASEGSFSAAARALGTTQPTVGRQVAALEEELGVTLFERLGTRLELTATGVELVEHVRSMGEAATRMSLVATGQALSVEGTVSITASEATAAFLLPPVLTRLRTEYPGIEIDIVASNQIRDLRRREADIAIRNTRTGQPELIVRKLRDTEGAFYASPDYIERAGPFDSAEDFHRAEIFAFDDSAMMIDGLRAFGLEVRPEQFPIMTGDHLVQWELCKRGVGICIMMREVGDAEPGVRRVFPDVPTIPVPIYLVCHRELRTSRRIRIVFDALVEALAAEPGG